MGEMGYSDDLVLPATTKTAMEMMLEACEDFGMMNKVLFSTDPDSSRSQKKCVLCVVGRSKKSLLPSCYMAESYLLYGLPPI